MYRILLQSQVSPNKPTIYQYLKDGNDIFEVDDIKIALDRYETELDNYEKAKLKLIRTIDIKMHLEGIDCCANCNGGSGVDPDVPSEGAISYNNLADKPTINNITLKYDKTAKDLHLQEEMTEYTNEELDQLLKIQG